MGAGIGVAWALYRMVLMRRRGDHRSSDRYIATAFGFAASAVVVSTVLAARARRLLPLGDGEPRPGARMSPSGRPATFSGESIVFMVMLAAVLVIVGFAVGRGVRPSTAACGPDRGDRGWPVSTRPLPGVVRVPRRGAACRSDGGVAPRPDQPPPAVGQGSDAGAHARDRGSGDDAARSGHRLRLGTVAAHPDSVSFRRIHRRPGRVLDQRWAAWFRRLGMVIVAALVIAVGCSAAVLATTPKSHFDAQVPAATLRAANAYADGPSGRRTSSPTRSPGPSSCGGTPI